MDKIYQIFVSSTFEDLKLERQEVMAAVVSTGNVPVGMEYFPAGNASPFDYIKQQIDSVDYYILIIAGKYGSINKEACISYTEMEFNYAVEKGVPIAVLQYRDITKLTGDKLEIDDIMKRALLEEFRKKSKEGRMVDFWESPIELRMKVKDAISNLIKNSPRTGWVRADQVRLIEEKQNVLYNQQEKAQSKLRKYYSMLKSIMVDYLFCAYVVVTPLEKRKFDIDVLHNKILFTINDMGDLYHMSLLLTKSLNKPAIEVYFEVQDRLYSELRTMIGSVELSYWVKLESIVFNFMQQCNNFAFKDSILGGVKEPAKSVYTKMIKEYVGDLEIHPSNAMNQFIALYYLLQINIPLVQQMAEEMKNVSEIDFKKTNAEDMQK